MKNIPRNYILHIIYSARPIQATIINHGDFAEK